MNQTVTLNIVDTTIMIITITITGGIFYVTDNPPPPPPCPLPPLANMVLNFCYQYNIQISFFKNRITGRCWVTFFYRWRSRWMINMGKML